MKNFKLSKKLKTLLWTSSALILNTAIASSLTSCSLFKKDIIDDIGGYDKKYGITQATYDKMESDFKEIYETNLETKHKQGEINDDQHESNLSSFRSRLNNFHNNMNSKENKTYSYTIKTGTLKNFAKDNYGIRLARYTGANLDDEISQIKNSMLVNLTMMINEYNVGNPSELKTKASSTFNDIVYEAKKHNPDDIVSIVQEVQENMIGCFTNIYKEMDLIATQKQLDDFLSNINVKVKDDVLKGKTEKYCWDKLGYKKDAVIPTNDFNNILDIEVKDHIPNLKSSLNDESSKIIEYSEDMITGYTLKPIVYDMVGDPTKNEYYIKVDFTLVNNRYKNDKDVDEVTAHSAKIKNGSIYDVIHENDDTSIFDINNTDEDREPSSFELPITKEFEKQQIKETYFYNDVFDFTWSKSDDYGIDNFWVKNNVGTFDENKLANTGMIVGGESLSNLLYQSQFSLSGGSLELKGYTDKAGSDENNWRLYKGVQEIDPKKIQIDSFKLKAATELPNLITISNDDGRVTWDKNITPGTYKFYVVATYVKEKDNPNEETVICKCKSDIITLKIINENNSNVVNQDVYLDNDIKFNDESDENKQLKLIDFVKYTDFWLDFEEIDKGATASQTKDEIKINEFKFAYTYHVWDKLGDERVFEIDTSDQDKIYDNMYNQLNTQKGISGKPLAGRTSNKLYSNVKTDYTNVREKIKITAELIDDFNKLHDSLDHDTGVYDNMLGWLTAFYGIMFAIWFCLPHRSSTKVFQKKSIAILIFLLIFLVGTYGAVIGVQCSIYSKSDEIQNLLFKMDLDESIKSKIPDQSKFKMVREVKTDEKYFFKEDAEGKKKWDGLDSSSKKPIKIYYESGYNEKGVDAQGNEIQSDLEEFQGGENNSKNLKESAHKFYNLMFLLWGLIVVAVVFLLAFFLVAKSLNKAANERLIGNEDLGELMPRMEKNNAAEGIIGVGEDVKKGNKPPKEEFIPKNKDGIPGSINDAGRASDVIDPTDNKKTTGPTSYLFLKLHAASQPKENCITNGILVFIRLAFCCK